MRISLDVPLLEFRPALALHCRVSLRWPLSIIEKILVELPALLTLVTDHPHFKSPASA